MSFAKQIKLHVDGLGKTLLDTTKIKELEKTKADKETTADLYERIARGYLHAPELHVTWISNLADYHEKNKRFIEAGQCYVRILGSSYEYLKLSGNEVIKQLDSTLLYKVSPSLKLANFDDIRALFIDDHVVFASTYFTESGFIETIENTIKLFEKAGYYEWCVDLNRYLDKIYLIKKDFERLSKLHSEMGRLYEKINVVQHKATRLFGTFYKVGFYSKKFKELNGKEFIYKFPKITRLAEVIQYIGNPLREKYGKEKVLFDGVTMEKIKGCQKYKNQEDICYVQITTVSPMKHGELNYFEKYTNIDKFEFQTPFTKTGKSQAKSMENQYKRKTILSIERPFPCVKTRVEVVGKTHKDFTPIENAIEIMESTVGRIKKVLAKDPPNMNDLQLVLSGTVIPQVNEGIPQIIRVFIGKEDLYERKFYKILSESVVTFFAHVKYAMSISEKYMKTEHEPLQKQFEMGYEKLLVMYEKHDKSAREKIQSQQQNLNLQTQ